MATVGRLAQGGDLLVSGEIDERLPQVTSGLVSHFSFDGQGGTFDNVGGVQPTTNQTTGVNLAEALNWQDPDAWGVIDTQADGSGVTWDETEQAIRFTGQVYRTLKIPLVIDYNKTYTFSCDIYAEDKTNGTGTWRLYIGGHREDETYARTTVNYDYSIKSSWSPTLQVWTHVTKTWTTGDVIYPSGWKAQVGSASGDTAFTRFWWFGGLWNYQGAATSSVLLKNVVIKVTDADTTNVTMDDNGLHLEPATTNDVPNPYPTVISNSVPGNYQPGWDTSLHDKAITVGNWSGGYNSGVTSPSTGYHAHWAYAGSKPWPTYGKSPCMVFNDENEQLLGLGHRWLGINNSIGTPSSNGWAVGDTIAISWRQKADNTGKGAQVGIYHMRIAEGTNGFESCIQRIDVTKPFEWERVSYTYVITSNWNLTSNSLIYVYGHHGTYGRLWVEDVQVEKLEYASTMVEGSRSAAGTAPWTSPAELCDITLGSIVLKIIPHSYEYSPTGYIDVFDSVNGVAGSDNFVILRKNATNLLPDTMFIRDNATWRSTNISSYLTDGVESTLIWTWSNGGNYQLIVDDVVVQTASYTTTDRPFDDFRFAEGITVTGFSVYDRVLSSEEITKLSGKSFTAKDNGVFILDDLYEGQSDFRDPTSSYNLAHSDKNLIDPDFVTGWGGNGSNTTKDFFGQTISVRDMSNTGNWTCTSPLVDIDSNTWYQFSIWWYAEVKTWGAYYLGMNAYNSSSTQINSITEAGTTSTNQYFRNSVTDSPDTSGDIIFDRWFQWKGYVLPDSVRTGPGVPTYLKQGWHQYGTDELTIDPERIIFMTTDTAKLRLRFLDYYNDAIQTTTYVALPCITAMEPLKVFNTGDIYTNRLLEDETL